MQRLVFLPPPVSLPLPPSDWHHTLSPCPFFTPPANPQVLRVLLDRLKNEVTRLAAVKALATIARSPLNIGKPLLGWRPG